MNRVLSKHDKIDRKTLEKQETLKVLFTLMAQGHKSDRAISKVLGINNTTLSRRRKKLEQEGYIKEYAIIPDFHKLGLDIIVFTFVSSTEAVTPAPSEFRTWVNRNPAVLCILQDEGLGATNWVIISVHKNYDDYVELFRKLQKESLSMQHRPLNAKVHSVIFHTSREFPKPFSLRNFGELFENTESS